MNAQLEVRLHGRRAGLLIRKENGNLQFRYDASYVDQGGPVLSHAMPLQAAAYSHRTCLAVFGGVLPEEDIRKGVSALLGISRTNDFQLLGELGGDCAGAIQFMDVGSSEAAPDEHRIRSLSEQAFHELLMELPQRPLAIDGSGEIRLSLAGAQPKVPIIRQARGFALPLSGGPASTHIIKPRPERFPDLVANEAFCMELAAAIGLDTADVDALETTGGLPYLQVRRYDRVVEVLPTRRLHQEDMCQALARIPDEKYQVEGGPSAADVIRLLRQASAVPARDVARFWDGLVFNVLVGNCDAHGKNWSLLYDAPRPRLAPFYDIVSTERYPELSTRLAMSIGSAVRLQDVELRHWEELASKTGLSRTYARSRVEAITTAAVRAARSREPAEVVQRDIVAALTGRAVTWFGAGAVEHE